MEASQSPSIEVLCYGGFVHTYLHTYVHFSLFSYGYRGASLWRLYKSLQRRGFAMEVLQSPSIQGA